MRDSFVATITDQLDKDEQVLLLTGDLGFGIFNDISDRFPERFINVGVAEQNMIGVGSGLSMMGKAVFCYSIANFVFMRGLEQFRNGAVYHDTNVTLVCSGGGFTYGQLGFTHFAIEDYGIISALGSVDIYHPSTSDQVQRAVEECAKLPGPKYLRLEKKELDFPTLATFGERAGLALHHQGEQYGIIAIGGLLEEAMAAAEQSNADVAVYSLPRHLALGDPEVKTALSRHSKLICIEEHVRPNSVGQKLQSMGFAVDHLAISDTGPSVVGDQAFLRNHYGLTVDGLCASLTQLDL